MRVVTAPGRYSAEEVRTREWIGDAIHSTVHPKHHWSGCNNPDLVYAWINRLGTYIADHPKAAEAFKAFVGDAETPA